MQRNPRSNVAQVKTDYQRPHCGDQRRRVGYGPQSGPTALRLRLPVAITDIDERGLKETEASITGPVLSRVLDVCDAAAQLSFADEVRDWTPTVVGAVFNNAGVALASTVLDGDPDDDQWSWNINFHGVVNGTRAFLPMLVEQNEGAIVNTSSVFGLGGVPNQSAYCAAKFAVRASPIRCATSCVAPG